MRPSFRHDQVVPDGRPARGRQDHAGVVDFGCWSRDERSAIRSLVTSEGASCHLVYAPVDHDTQRARIAHRQATTPEQTFPMSEAELLRWRSQFEEPDAAELEGHRIDGPPPGWAEWREWAAHRWPSLD
ncbi:AAA family ATPase [Streptomyces sp. UC4497]